MAPDPALTQQAQKLLSSGRAAEAADICLQALRDFPADPSLLTLLARCDEARGDLQGACARLESAVAEAPEYLAGQFHLGRLLAGLGRLDQARERFDICLQFNPNDAPARTLLARLDVLAGNRAQAISSLRTALRADARHVPALATLADLLVEDGQLEAAHELASRALRINPDLPTVQMSMARVLLAQGHLSFAEQCLVNASHSMPQDPSPYFLLGQLKGRQGQFDQALSAFDAARQRGYNGLDLNLAKARCLRSLGRFDQARAQYDALVQSEDAAAELVLEAAEFCIEADMPGPARVLLARPSVRPLPARVLLLAQLADREGDSDQARQLAATLHDSEDRILASAARRLSARLALAADDGRAALDALATLLERTDSPSPVHWLGAEIMQSLDDHEAAVTTLNRLLDRPGLDPEEETKTRAQLVTVLDRAERYRDAAAQMRQAEWRAPVIPAGAEQLDEEVWERLLAGITAARQPDDGRIQPVFVAGAPGSGRELWLAALTAIAQVQALPRARFAERKRVLELPVDASRVAERDEGDLRLIRRRFLRAFGRLEASCSVLLETGMPSALDLVWLSRIFPGATVLVPNAEEADLRLHWRLAGYRDQGQMLAAWQREHKFLEQLRASVAMDWQLLPLAELYQDPASALTAVSGHLGLQADASALAAMDRARIEFNYRVPGHWQHYRFD